MRRRPDRASLHTRRGYTIIELMIALSIVGIVAAMAGTQYASYLARARTARAIVELEGIAHQLEYLRDEGLTLPKQLADIQIAAIDPWGNPYQYLKIAGQVPSGVVGRGAPLPAVSGPGGGTGFAATGGSAASGSSGTSGGSGTSSGSGTSGSSLGGSSGTSASGSGASSGTSGSGSASTAGGIGGAPSGAGGGQGGATMGEVRKDRFMAPINTDFDLYSMGPDGESQGPLSVPVSRDDVIRANDGAYYGVAADF